MRIIRKTIKERKESMATGKALDGQPYAGNPHVRFDEGEVAPAATLRRGSLLYKEDLINAVKSTGNKYAIALSASTNRGKTAILRKLADIFRADVNYRLVDVAPMKTDKDEMWCFEHSGVRMGIITGGDDDTAVDMGFDFASRNNCQIVFCATRYYANSPSWKQFVNRCSSGGYIYDWQTVKVYSDATLDVMHSDVAQNVLWSML